jgi:fatty-acid peroxygenase
MIPELRIPDSSASFLHRGYTFIGWHCDRLGVDAFRTRLMFRPLLCMRGEAAAELFYAPGAFTRVGAVPRSAGRLLQDEGSVQMLDGAAHRHRKSLFIAMAGAGASRQLAEIFEEEWHSALQQWKGRSSVVLQKELIVLLTRAGMRWAGIDPAGQNVAARAREFGAMVENAGSVGPANLMARLHRHRTERWARGLIEEMRLKAGAGTTPATPLGALATFTDEAGQPLDAGDAAVELINLLRPIVAIGRFVVFAAVALEQQPQWADRFRAGELGELTNFVNEVRRFYPFFPFMAGVALRPFEWDGEELPAGTWVMLDLYGTNHDPRLWSHPGSFRPERFHTERITPNNLVPQGAGDPAAGHRCPGEDITVGLLETAVRLLAEARLALPTQDLSISLRRIPALPASGVILSADGMPADRTSI